MIVYVRQNNQLAPPFALILIYKAVLYFCAYMLIFANMCLYLPIFSSYMILVSGIGSSHRVECKGASSKIYKTIIDLQINIYLPMLAYICLYMPIFLLKGSLYQASVPHIQFSAKERLARSAKP